MKNKIIFSILTLTLCLLNIIYVSAETQSEAQSELQSEPQSDPLTSEEAFFKRETAEVPIVMYHLVTKNSRLLGKWGITPDELESDLKYLKDNGYQTIFMEDVIDFVHNGKRLPDKPIILTFDDGNSSDHRYLYPLLQEYDMKAVVSVLGKFVDDCTVLASKQEGPRYYPNLTWEQAKEMGQSPYIELQSHSYNLHGGSGSTQKKGESVETYHKRLKDDLTKMQERIKEMADAEPNTFTYPYGMISENSQAVLEEMGFKASLSCRNGMNILEEDNPECLFRLKRQDRPSGVHISTILREIEKSK